MKKGENNNRLFLLDAYALIYRGYYAFINNPLRNSRGQNISAVFAFVNTLNDLLTNEKPSHLAVVFDSSDETTERKQEFDFYKANRERMPEDIETAIPVIKQIIEAYNIPMLEMEGYEADDIIGTLAKKKEKDGYKVYMVTPDKDFAQLVSDNIFMYKPSRQGKGVEIIGPAEVRKKWEVESPEQVIDILGLWGDAVDNIPGIPGIGEKTAKKLVKTYGSVEGLIERADELSGKQKDNVLQFADQGLISKKLATIILDLPVDVSDEDLEICEPDKEKLSQIFAELEFRNLGKKILGEDFTVNVKTEVQIDLFSADKPLAGEVVAGNTLENTDHNYHLLKNEDDISKLKNKIKEKGIFAFDTETSGLNAISSEIVGISFSYKKGEACYLNFPEGSDECVRTLTQFKELFEDDEVLKIGQNLKFDMHVLKNYGIEIQEPFYDTMVAHYLIEPEKRHSMAFLSETFLGYTPQPIEALIGKKGKRQKSMRTVPLEDVKEYAAEDADITFQLYQIIQKLAKDRGVNDLLQNVELPLIPVLCDMEHVGVRLDVPFLKEMSKELNKDLRKIQQDIIREAGMEFNIDSPKQLGQVLFETMKLPYSGKKTKTGQYSTGEDVLSKLENDFPIAGSILNYREIKKLKSTYIDTLPVLINPKTGRIHTTFNQTIAATGRLSSLGPNLQNIPIRTDKGREVRKAFIPRDEDHLILSADYSQIELRIIAALSKEPNMLEDFKKGTDIHTATACRVFDVKEEEITREMRTRAKAVNFGLIYGQGAFGLAQQLRIGRSEAGEIIKNYFEKYSRIREYMEHNKEFARLKGYVETILGRRRYLPDIHSKNRTVRGFAERNAINAPIQGSAADLIKMAMIKIYREMKKRSYRSVMMLQVHDELVFDAHKDEVQDLREMVCDKMQNAIEIDVPIVVESGIGNNWLEAH